MRYHAGRCGLLTIALFGIAAAASPMRDPIECGAALAKDVKAKLHRLQRIPGQTPSRKITEVPNHEVPAGCLAFEMPRGFAVDARPEGFVLLRGGQIIGLLVPPGVTAADAIALIDLETTRAGGEGRLRIVCADGLACNAPGPDHLRLYRINTDGSRTLRADVMVVEKEIP